MVTLWGGGGEITSGFSASGGTKSLCPTAWSPMSFVPSFTCDAASWLGQGQLCAIMCLPCGSWGPLRSLYSVYAGTPMLVLCPVVVPVHLCLCLSICTFHVSIQGSAIPPNLGTGPSAVPEEGRCCTVPKKRVTV